MMSSTGGAVNALQEELQMYDQKLEDTPFDSNIFYEKGQVLVRLAEYLGNDYLKEAQKCYQKAISLDEKDDPRYQTGLSQLNAKLSQAQKDRENFSHDVEELFNQIDLDKDGMISKEEFVSALFNSAIRQKLATFVKE
eukprot:TRINITY_DN2687_c0_g1_i1.p1 TRINITY_DN2687_c0_g1~~TRINITY_DN2687_c0_g1_i1.p1  ORF type:complete len:138 (+),score=28.73 TRINITY_DN2687_c0_g1_i1:86-499(+)